ASEARGRCAAQFTAGPATLTDVVLSNVHDHATVNVTSRPLTSRKRNAQRPLTFSCPADALPAGRDVHGNHFYAAKISAGARWFLLSARQKLVRVWHVLDGRLVGELKFRGLPNQAAFSPDSSMFAIDAGTTVYIHRTQTLEQVAAWRVKYSY